LSSGADERAYLSTSHRKRIEKRLLWQAICDPSWKNFEASMEQVRRWTDQSDETAMSAVDRLATVRGRSPAEAMPTPITTAAERRLRLIIESAPVSLIVVDKAGQVLAANRATLTLFDRRRFEDVVGMSITALAAPESHELLAAFVTRICDGEAGSVEYSVAWPDGTQRRLETHAVPIRRADDDVSVFLGASWDVSTRDHANALLEELQTHYASVESERDTLRSALDEAKTAASRLELHRANERAQADDQRQRLHAALTEVEQRHTILATEWTVERESLTSRLASTDRERAELSRELDIERASARAALREVDQAHQEAQAAEEARKEFAQLLRHTREQHETDVEAVRTERDKLVQAIQTVNASYAALVSERGAERTEFEAALEAERFRSVELMSERDRFRTDLSAILQTLQEAGVQTQQLLDRCRTLRLVSNGEPRDTGGLENPSTAARTESEECSWQF
jgi:PAS domain S-box-containing protein